MAETTFRIRRKQDGWVSDPITQEQAEGIAGWPSDWEKLPEVKPVVVKDESAPKARSTASKTTARKATASRAPAKAAPAPTATATTTPTSAPAASDTASES